MTTEPRTGSRLLLLSNGSEQQGTTRLFRALAQRWQERGHAVKVVPRDMPRGVLNKARGIVSEMPITWRRVREADVLVVHTALALSLPAILMARAQGKPVVAFVWDIYPESTRQAGTIQSRPLLWMYAMAERTATRLATLRFIPSDDYRDHVPDALEVHRYPMWPTGRQVASSPPRSWPAPVLAVGFAGQINGVRGLRTAAAEIVCQSPSDASVALEVFSADPIPADLQDLADSDPRLGVTHHGFVDPGELADRFETLHFGLVSIDEAFTLPAFPSKAMAYLAAGLPILYTGRRLPAFENELREHGIGMVLGDRKMTHESLAEFLGRYPSARERYLERLAAEWDALDRLL